MSKRLMTSAMVATLAMAATAMLTSFQNGAGQTTAIITLMGG